MQQADGNRRALGPVIGLIVILGIILAGGVYFYSTIKTSTEYNAPANNPYVGGKTSTTTNVEKVSTSSEPDALEADINAYGSADIDSINSNF